MLWVMAGGVIGSLGAVGLKAGSSHLEKNLVSLLKNWRLMAGVAAYLASSVLFVKGMSEGQLSVLYPLVAMGQIWTLIWARIFFHERITRYKLIAVALILIGIALIGYGNSQLTEEAPAHAAHSTQ
jgi:drug/metabolite transporter (DMT)-like permease